eukprot:CAMPEP_0201581984 /NCGR_PEP_ID=MMETSP0190_2-20130828/78290_1 /ASSEMBLY_ACC=CAM_ASM_000263 /TAXON_ID=37353 /ORGANISM="Rosalina sp." /LENGTH=798 /DNA_ID=CAMNT_0048021017 /DNA_START=25 /DNA_END=2421 /DNA_ORIENTATION=-
MSTLLLFLLSGISLSLSATVYVNSNNKVNGNGKSWSSAYNNLVDAIPAATGQGAEIWIAQGTYYPTKTQSSTDRTATFLLNQVVSIYGGFNGSESSVNQRPTPLLDTILSGNIGDSSKNTDNSYHVINLDVQHVVLDGLIIEGGYAMNDNVSNYTNCPTCFGGAIYDGCFQMQPKEQVRLFVNGCTFRNNTAISGGAIFGMCTTDYLITNSIFESNQALNGAYKGGYGGAIMVAYIGDMNVSNSTFKNNMASGSGGASHCDYGMICRYDNCIFDSNVVKEGNGAALSLIDRDSQRGFSSLYVDQSTFTNNMCENTVAGSAGYGGAIYLFDNDAGGFITNSKFTGNTANLGGAMGFYGQSHCKGCCAPNSGNTFTNNVGKNGDDNCFGPASFPEFSKTPITVDNPLTYLMSMYSQANSFVDPNTPTQSANIVYVNINSKSLKPDGSSWSDAYSSLQDGVDAAEAILTKDKTTTVELWVAGSANYAKGEKYIPERVPMWYNTSAPYYDATKSKMIEIPDNIRLFGGFAGTETKREQRDWSKNPTLIDAFVSDTQQTYQVVYVHENVYIDGFMIANGYAFPGPPPEENKLYQSGAYGQTNPDQVLTDPTPVRGAGIFSNVTKLNVANVLFYGHYSTKGSGFYVLGNPTFKHNVTGYNLGFIGNYATERGGAFAVDLYGEFNCVGCLFWTNVCSHKGGAVYSDFWSHSIFDQCTFYNNTGYDSGGAIGMDAGYSQITNSNFTSNYAFSEGAALYTGSYNPFGGGDDELPNHYLLKNNYYKDNVCASGNIAHYLWAYDYWVAL